MYGNWNVTWPLLSITNVLASFLGQTMNNTVTAPFRKWASTEGQRFLVMYVWPLKGDRAAVFHNKRTGSLLWQNNEQHGHCPILKVSVKGVSMIFSLVCTVIEKWPGRCFPWSQCYPPSLAKQWTTRSVPHYENERQRSVIDFWLCILCNLSSNCSRNIPKWDIDHV